MFNKKLDTYLLIDCRNFNNIIYEIQDLVFDIFC
jgi:hypothetical protein